METGRQQSDQESSSGGKHWNTFFIPYCYISSVIVVSILGLDLKNRMICPKEPRSWKEREMMKRSVEMLCSTAPFFVWLSVMWVGLMSTGLTSGKHHFFIIGAKAEYFRGKCI